MKIVIPALFFVLLIGCSPAQQETALQDSTEVIYDTAVLVEDKQVEPGEEYIIENGYSYISSPFDFHLDSATIKEILGDEAVITSRETPAGEDEMGSYEAYSFYEVAHPEAKLSFFSYIGKHFADISTPKLPFKNGVVVGMSKTDFITAMSLPGEAGKSNTFTINDDYGSMSFYFVDEKLSNIYLNYEEGD